MDAPTPAAAQLPSDRLYGRSVMALARSDMPHPAADHDDCLNCKRTIHAARAGDRMALSRLLRALQDVWYRLSLSLLRDPELATDAVQETGLRFLRQVSGFRGDSQLRTWSLGIAINVAREFKRHAARQSAAVSLSAGEEDSPTVAQNLQASEVSVQDRAELADQRSDLRTVLSELPERQREALVLRFFEDLSVDETARAMGCAAGTVKATVHQALQSLRRRLSRWM